MTLNRYICASERLFRQSLSNKQFHCQSLQRFPSGCHIGFAKFGDNTIGQDEDDSDNNDATVAKITIATDVLASINRNLALVAPMRGGLMFGTIKSNVANIKYFLYDYASKANGYSPSDNLDTALLGIVTMGAQTMAVIKEHEVKLSDDAKISFYVKERGKSAVAASIIETYSSGADIYQKMESNIVSRHDAYGKA